MGAHHDLRPKAEAKLKPEHEAEAPRKRPRAAARGHEKIRDPKKQHSEVAPGPFQDSASTNTATLSEPQLQNLITQAVAQALRQVTPAHATSIQGKPVTPGGYYFFFGSDAGRFGGPGA